MKRKPFVASAVTGILSLFAAAAVAGDTTTLFKQTFETPLTYCMPGDSCPGGWAITDQSGAQHYGSPCDPNNIACVQETGDNGDSFLRMTINHDPTQPLGYDNAEYAGTRTGYSYNQGQYCISPGQTQIFYQSARLGPGYNADGSGGNVGTAGHGPWNSYVDIANNTLHPANAAWWQWSEKGSLLGIYDGLSASVVYQNQFLFRQPFPSNVDIHKWWSLAITRFGNADGTENWSFVLTQFGNSYNLGGTTSPAMGCLTYEAWNDNQFVTFDPQTFQIIQSFHTPASTQYWDLKLVEVDQR